MIDFNSHNIIWGSKTTNKRSQILEKIINSNSLCLHNQKSQTHRLGKYDKTHLDPSLGSFSAIELTLNDPSIFIDYNWRVCKGPCSSDHYPLLMENSTIKKKLGTTWNFKRANWQSNHTNPRIKYKLRRTHNTFYQHSHYHSQ